VQDWWLWEAAGLSNDTTLLFGLEGVEVVSVELDDEANPLPELVTAAETARCCPGCGVRSAHPHSWVRTRPRDLPIAGRRSVLTWTKRRWRCGNPECARPTFTGSIPQIPPRSRLTGRLREAVGAAVADHGRMVIQAARDYEVSWPIAQAAFAVHTRLALPAETPQVARLGIDEIRRGKARFRLMPGPGGDETWEVVADTWHVGMVDLGGGAGLLGQVEGRTAAAVSAWIEAQSPAWRAGVHIVAIDMCTVFKAAIRTSLPHATPVVDRFHVAQLANAALTEVRRRVTVQQRGLRGRKGNREWELRNRLTRAGARMHAKHLDPMIDDLRALPAKIGVPILKAWNVRKT
jgi:transposase